MNRCSLRWCCSCWHDYKHGSAKCTININEMTRSVLLLLTIFEKPHVSCPSLSKWNISKQFLQLEENNNKTQIWGFASMLLFYKWSQCVNGESFPTAHQFQKKMKKKIPLLCREFKIINDAMHDVPALCNIMNRAPDCHTHWIRVYNTIPENTTTCVTSCLNAGIQIKNSLSTSLSLKVYLIY